NERTLPALAGVLRRRDRGRGVSSGAGTPAEATVVSKGTDPADDGGYSAFDGTELESGRSLCDLLRSAGVTHLLVGGLATDYCVRASVLDARRAGFEVTVLLDAIRGIDIEPGDLACAVAEMAAAGARF